MIVVKEFVYDPYEDLKNFRRLLSKAIRNKEWFLVSYYAQLLDRTQSHTDEKEN